MKGIAPERVVIGTACKEVAEDFLLWLEAGRGNGIPSRNQRLAATHAFFRCLQCGKPELMLHCQRVVSAPSKKAPKKPPVCLPGSEMGRLLAMPGMKTCTGRRDAAMLPPLCGSGARVQELADTTPRNLRLEEPFHVALAGKGRKTRHAPIMRRTASLLASCIKEQKIDGAGKLGHPLFFNHWKEKLARQGIGYIISKYSEGIGSGNNISAHVFCHSKAMALTQAGVSPIYIRGILGHAGLKTASAYSKSSIEMKRKALEKIESTAIPDIPDWTADSNLMDFLKSLGK
ncbi:MAG: tyrosine-type recombinase/integrase [Eubacteriaceae bacterium]|nr:tyrosine-type recombinase/integrase [Eubacteriaceae bacterium]